MKKQEENQSRFIKLKSKKGSAYIGNNPHSDEINYATYKSSKNYIYQGQIYKNKFDGIGKITILNKKQNFYLGKFFNGKFEEIGKVRHSGVEFISEYKDGQINGIGHFTDLKKNTHKGNFLNGLHTGFGVIESKDKKSLRKGWFLHGRKEGISVEITKETDSSCTTVTGNYKKNKKHGVFEIKNSKKKYPIFKGNFIQNEKSGFAIVNSVKDNTLILTYQGVLKRGIKEGYGRLINNKTKFVYTGEFRNNDFFGLGNFENGSYCYKGNFYQGKKHGIGYKIFKETGDYYFGQWRFGAMSGYGVMKFGEKVFKGKFKDGVKEGYGVSKFPGDEPISGFYRYGKIKEFVDVKACLDNIEGYFRKLNFKKFILSFEKEFQVLEGRVETGILDLDSNSEGILEEVGVASDELEKKIFVLEKRFKEVENDFFSMKLHLDTMLKNSNSHDILEIIEESEKILDFGNQSKIMIDEVEWSSREPIYNHNKIFSGSGKKKFSKKKNSKKKNFVNKCSRDNILAYPEGYSSKYNTQNSSRYWDTLSFEEIETITKNPQNYKKKTGFEPHLNIDALNTPVKLNFSFKQPLTLEKFQIEGEFDELSPEKGFLNLSQIDLSLEYRNFMNPDKENIYTKRSVEYINELIEGIKESEKKGNDDERREDHKNNFSREKLLDELTTEIEILEKEKARKEMELELKRLKLKNKKLEKILSKKEKSELKEKKKFDDESNYRSTPKNFSPSLLLDKFLSSNSSKRPQRSVNDNLDDLYKKSFGIEDYSIDTSKFNPLSTRDDDQTKNNFLKSENNESEIKIEDLTVSDFSKAFNDLRQGKILPEGEFSRNQLEAKKKFEIEKIDLGENPRSPLLNIKLEIPERIQPSKKNFESEENDEFEQELKDLENQLEDLEGEDRDLEYREKELEEEEINLKLEEIEIEKKLRKLDEALERSSLMSEISKNLDEKEYESESGLDPTELKNQLQNEKFEAEKILRRLDEQRKLINEESSALNSSKKKIESNKMEIKKLYKSMKSDKEEINQLQKMKEEVEKELESLKSEVAHSIKTFKNENDEKKSRAQSYKAKGDYDSNKLEKFESEKKMKKKNFEEKIDVYKNSSTEMIKQTAFMLQKLVGLKEKEVRLKKERLMLEEEMKENEIEKNSIDPDSKGYSEMSEEKEMLEKEYDEINQKLNNIEKKQVELKQNLDLVNSREGNF